MNLSKEQIEWLREIEPTYAHAGDDMRDKTLSSFVSSTKGGKSTLIGRIVDLAGDPRWVSEVDTITPRPRRHGEDPAGYRTGDEGITNEVMIEHIKNRELVNWKLFDTGDIYGTDKLSYPAQHNLLPTMAEAIPMLGRVAFASMHVIYVVRPLEDWKKYLPDNFEDPKWLGRMIEAKKSLSFAKGAQGIIRVVNYEDDELLDRTAKGLLEIVTTSEEDYRSGVLDDYHDREFETHLYDMAEHVDEILREAGLDETEEEIAYGRTV